MISQHKKIVNEKAYHAIASGSCMVAKEIAPEVLELLEREAEAYGSHETDHGYVIIEKLKG